MQLKKNIAFTLLNLFNIIDLTTNFACMKASGPDSSLKLTYK